MLGSLLMFGGAYRTKKWAQASFIVLWVAYMLLNSQFAFGWQFPVVNAIVGVMAVILTAKLSNKNNIYSVFTILIYSILIDTVSYLLFPLWRIDTGIAEYIINGIVFNYKNILLPLIAYVAAEAVKRTSIVFYKKVVVKG